MYILVFCQLTPTTVTFVSNGDVLKEWHISTRLVSPQGPPKPVAVEPCSGSKAAVLTVLLCLPRGASGVPPPGQSGQYPTSSNTDLESFLILSFFIDSYKTHRSPHCRTSSLSYGGCPAHFSYFKHPVSVYLWCVKYSHLFFLWVTNIWES